MFNNNRGAIDAIFIVLLVVLIVGAGFVWWRIDTANNEVAKTTEQAEAASDQAIYAVETNTENEQPPVEQQPEPTESEPETNQTITPEPEPVEQEVDLYNSAQEEFVACPPQTTAYVVNPNGAKLADGYYSEQYVKTIALGVQVVAGCQDGVGPSSMTVTVDGGEYTANPADFRTSNPN